MDPKKRAYLESIGLRADATDEQAQQFYDLLSSDKQAAADTAGTDAPADTMPAATKEDKVTEPLASIAAASVLPNIGDIVAACEGDKACAVDYFQAGFTVDQAKAAYGGIKAANAKTAEAIAAQKRAEFVASGDKPIGTAGGESSAGDSDAKAKSDWADMTAAQRNEWIDQDAYVASRKREIARGK